MSVEYRRVKEAREAYWIDARTEGHKASLWEVYQYYGSNTIQSLLDWSPSLKDSIISGNLCLSQNRGLAL
jgi:hypothetical protein